MDAMIVITANWAIGDGSFGMGTAIDARPWLQSVHLAAHRGGFGRDGRYRPVHAVDVVFAGDTFDGLTSAVWTTAARPWHAGAMTTGRRQRVLEACVRRARGLLAGLARWVRRGLPVPAADRNGRPRVGELVKVPVRVVFLAGDRDAWLEDAATVAGRFGYGTGTVWGDDTVEVRHGAELDPLSGGAVPPGRPADRCPTLGESITVDLVARFGAVLLEHGHARRGVARLIASLGAVGPLDMPAALVHWMMTGRPQTVAVRPGIIDLWRYAVDAWHRVAHVDRPLHALACCPLDALADALVALDSTEATADRAAASGLADVVLQRSRPEPRRRDSVPPPRRVVVLGHAGVVRSVADGERGGPVMCLGPSAPPRSTSAAGPAPDGACGIMTVTGRREPVGDVTWQSLPNETWGRPMPLDVIGMDRRWLDAA